VYFYRHQKVNNLSVYVGRESVALTGEPLLTHGKGSLESSSHRTGVVFGGMHYSTHRSDDYELIEMFYGGVQDGIVTIY
jgi:hypothetical protein